MRYRNWCILYFYFSKQRWGKKHSPVWSPAIQRVVLRVEYCGCRHDADCGEVHRERRGTTRLSVGSKDLGVFAHLRPSRGRRTRRRATRPAAGHSDGHPPSTWWSSRPASRRRRRTTCGTRWRNEPRSRDSKMAAGHMTTRAVRGANRTLSVAHLAGLPVPQLQAEQVN